MHRCDQYKRGFDKFIIFFVMFQFFIAQLYYSIFKYNVIYFNMKKNNEVFH
jgi:hypothetical protein